MMFSARRLMALTLVMSSPAAACGADALFLEPPPETPPDEAIASFLTKLPAVAVAVVDGGEVVYSKVAGVRRSGSATPVANDDAFQIGSMTKAMTALLAGTVVDAGQLTWDSTVGEVLAGTIAIGAPYGNVTLAQLLNQVSGIPTEFSSPGAWNGFQDISRPTASERRRMAMLALAEEPRSAPGTAFLYSNFNYVVAGLMLEVVTGKSWESLMTDRLFVPMEMSHAGFGPPGTPGTLDAPRGHNPAPAPDFFYADNPPALGPAGTVHANLDDMLNYVRLYFDGGVGPNGRILSQASLSRMETPLLGSYGFGWWLPAVPSEPLLMVHNGSNTFFYSWILVLPSRRAAIIMMTNRGDIQGAWPIGDQLLDYLAAHFGFPRKPRA